MFDRFGIGTKLSAGFALTIALALTGGLFAAWRMTSVSSRADALAREQVPEIALANAMERGALEAMLAARAYVVSEDPAQLEGLRTNLAAVRQAAKEAAALAARDRALLAMGQASARVAAGAEQVEELAAGTARLTEDMQRQRAAADAAARRYQEVALAFEKVQNDALQGEIIAGLEGDQLLLRLQRITLTREALALGDSIVSDAWKAQLQRDPTLLGEALKRFDQLNQRLDTLRGLTTFPGDLARLEECRRAAAESRRAMETFLQAWAQQRVLAQERLGALVTAIVGDARATATLGLGDVKRGAEEASEAVTLSSRVMLLGLLLAALLAAVIALVVTREVTRPLNGIILALSESASQVAAAAGQVSERSQQMATEASAQAANVEEVSSALVELSSMTGKNADGARAADGTVARASDAAGRGAAGVERLGEAIGNIQHSANQTAQIVKTIDEIAFQTNLLALNAAVEAARAGEAGQGFAVVASEVGVLAQRSAAAARSTAALIEESQQRALGGAKVATEVQEVLREISARIGEVTALVGGVATASGQQASGIQQITGSVGGLDRFNQSAAAGARESAAASEALSQQAVELQGLVGRLTVMVNGAGTGVLA
jgi:methyl-accepting chemotaxis protein